MFVAKENKEIIEACKAEVLAKLAGKAYSPDAVAAAIAACVADAAPDAASYPVGYGTYFKALDGSNKHVSPNYAVGKLVAAWFDYGWA